MAKECVLFSNGPQEVRVATPDNPEGLYIRITKHRTEVIYWDSAEWVEDPSVLLHILAAIRMVVAGEDVKSKFKKPSRGRSDSW